MSVGRIDIASVLVCIKKKNHAIILPIVIFQCGHADTSIIVVFNWQRSVLFVCHSTLFAYFIFWQLLVLKIEQYWHENTFHLEHRTNLFCTNSTVTARRPWTIPFRATVGVQMSMFFSIQVHKKGGKNVQNWEKHRRHLSCFAIKKWKIAFLTFLELNFWTQAHAECALVQWFSNKYNHISHR